MARVVDPYHGEKAGLLEVRRPVSTSGPSICATERARGIIRRTQVIDLGTS